MSRHNLGLHLISVQGHTHLKRSIPILSFRNLNFLETNSITAPSHISIVKHCSKSLTMISKIITSFWFVAAAAFITPVAALRGWNRIMCQREIVLMLESGKLLPNDTKIFAMSPRGQSLMSDINKIALTTSGCSRFCDSARPTLYPDSIPRLTQWLLPVLLLIVNMTFGSSRWEVLVSVTHILGDPIHATWSLLAKVESWNRSLVIAEKVHTSLKRRQPDNQQDKTYHKLEGTPTSNDQVNKSGVVVCAVEEAILQPTNSDPQDIQGKQLIATQIQHIAVIIASLSELFRPFNTTENPEAILQTFTLTLFQPITSPLSINLLKNGHRPNNQPNQ